MPDPIPPTGNNNSPTVKFGAGAWALVIGLTLISFFIFHIDFYPAAVGSLVIVYLFLRGNSELKAQRPGNSTQEADPSNTSTSEQSAQIAFEFESAPASPASIVPEEPARETAAAAAQSVVLSKPRSVNVGKVFLMGCLLPTGILAGLLVVGMSFVHYVQTKNVEYSDVLTTYNDHVFQQHHSWSDSGAEKGNTDAAEMAMARLGHAAYGKTFRELIDGEKREEKKIATALATATTSPTDSPETAVPATAAPPSAAPDLLDPDNLEAYLNSASSPPWMHLFPGQRAILKPDAELNGNPNDAYICNSLAAVESGLAQGAPDPDNCVEEPAGGVVLFESLHAVHGPQPQDRHLQAFVKSEDGGWSGYADFDQLVPIIPVGTALKTRIVQDMVEPFRRPHLDSVESYETSRHTDFTKARGVEIGEVNVNLLRWVPFHPYDASGSSYQALVQVTSGELTGKTGWIEDEFLTTSNGFNVSCFCPPDETGH